MAQLDLARSRDETFYDAIARKGIDRRSFLKFCAAVAGMLGLEASGAAAIAQALERKKKVPVVWLEFQDCAGCTESLLRAAKPAIDELVLEAISLDYHETIMAAAGRRAHEALEKTIQANPAGYIAVVEGSIPTKDGGIYCVVGGRSALDLAREVCRGALAVLAVGSCSAYGGLARAAPDPTGAISVEEAVPEARAVVNLPGCPFNPANVTATIVHFLTYGRLPALDALNRPLFAYGERIHDNCERRGHFDAGRFPDRFGDEGHRHGYCLYKLGCKGPISFSNCPTIRWNEGMGWPIGAGHPCLGCVEPGFWDRNTPFYRRLPTVAGFASDATADKIGLGLVGATALAFTAHGIAKSIQRARGRQLPVAPEPATKTGTPGLEHDRDEEC